MTDSKDRIDLIRNDGTLRRLHFVSLHFVRLSSMTTTILGTAAGGVAEKYARARSDDMPFVIFTNNTYRYRRNLTIKIRFDDDLGSLVRKLRLTVDRLDSKVDHLGTGLITFVRIIIIRHSRSYGILWKKIQSAPGIVNQGRRFIICSITLS